MFQSGTDIILFSLLSPQCELLQTLGKKCRFEIAIGMNGRVWISSHSVSITLFILNTLSEVEDMSDSELTTLSQQILNQFEVVTRRK